MWKYVVNIAGYGQHDILPTLDENAGDMTKRGDSPKGTLRCDLSKVFYPVCIAATCTGMYYVYVKE